MRLLRRCPMLVAALVFVAPNAVGDQNVTISRGSVGLPHAQQAGAVIALVQSGSVSGSSVPSISVGFPSANTKGNLIVAFVRLSTTSQSVKVSDTAGNPYTDAVSQAQDTDGHKVHIFYAANVVGGPNTITATFAGANNHSFLAVYEYSGVNTLDRAAATQGYGSAPNSGATQSTSNANELVFAAIGLPASYTGTPTHGSGFTGGLGTADAATEYEVVTSTGSFAATFNLSSSANWTAVVATFFASGTPPAATLAFSGLSTTANSGQQMPFDVVLGSPAIQPVSGQLTLSFQPDATVTADDPAIQFPNGSRNASFSIPAGATKAVFSVSQMALQTGTVAGTITLTGSSNLPAGNFTQKLVIPRAPPVMQNATVIRNSAGFHIQISGFSNTRDLAGASFHFTAASGQPLQTSDLSVNLSAQASQWYNASSSTQFGGQFLLLVPFTLQQGTPSGLSTVGVQLQNGQGTSVGATAKF